MKTFLSFLFLLLVVNANAKNYYFSSTSGDDSRTAAQANNSATPWKSIGKLNSIFSILVAGDSILFKRGDVFHGAITVAKSGTASSPIVFSAYGSGSKPMISSLVTFSNWNSIGNGIYESSNSELGAKINIVLFNGKQQEMGRYPNSETANNGYLMYESHVGRTSITDNQLSSSVNWTGAELVLRTRRWVIDRNLINSHSGTTITYTASNSYEPYNNNGYFIQNSIKTLDRLGEWYYSPSTKKLSMYFGSNSPSSFAVQASAREDLISVTSYNYLVFDNLEIRGANASGIKIRNGTSITIKNCDVDFSGQDGINVSSHDYLKIENSTVTNSNENGINLNYSGDFATIRNNKITNTALFLGFNGNGDGKGIGIKTFGNGNVVEYNEILNTGYIGIYFNGNNAVIKNNLVDRFCMSKDDGAGIYTWQGDVADYKNRKLIGNIVVNGAGAGPGTDNPTYLPVEGIYFDNGASFVECRDNTIANCGNNGVFLHNAHDLVLRNNTFYNCNRQFTAIQKENNIAMRNNVITNNIFFSKQVTQLASYLKSNLNDIKDFGKMDSNYYARPLDDRLVIFNNYVKNGSGVSENFVLENWKDKYNKDLASKRTAKQIAPYRLNRLLTASKVTNGLFATTVTGVQNGSCSVAWSNDGKMDGGFLAVTPASRNSTVYLSVGALTAGKKYVVKYTVRGSIDSSSTISTYLRQALSPYTNLTPTQTRAITLSKSDNEMLFICATTEANATVVFRVDDRVKYYLDNISVYEADAFITDVDDSLRFEYNASKSSKTISLGDDYVDAKNNKFSGSITLQPYTSAVLIKQNVSSSTAPANVAPVVALTSPAADAGFTSPATISIAATATDSDGTVSKVDFYKGSTLIGSDNTSPYTYSWGNVAAGSYTITAKATDNDGAVKTSASVAVNVTAPVVANVAPVVALTSPAANASFTSPATISIAAAATDSDGTVSKVDFYKGSTLIG
ncbi:MAG: Ig-like domain-containing protein, partial [Ginsengibacter sp.]